MEIMDNIKIDIKKEQKILYLNNLINRIFKIIYLYEENENSIPSVYIERLILEINSSNNLFNGVLIDLIVKINCINFLGEKTGETIEKVFKNKMKSIVFESINLCKKNIEDIQNDFVIKE